MAIGGFLVLLSVGSLALLSCGTRHKSLNDEIQADIPRWARVERLPANVLPGARVFAAVGCLTCHTYLGTGSPNLGARDLTAEGTRKNAAQLRAYIADPARFGDRLMPKYQTLGAPYLDQIAAFLAASKGPR